MLRLMIRVTLLLTVLLMWLLFMGIILVSDAHIPEPKPTTIAVHYI